MRVFRFIVAGLVFALSACASAPSAPPAPLRAPLEGARRIEPPSPVGYATSRDGENFLFSADPNGTMNAFAVSTEGGDPRALTTELSSDVIALSYFPNDDRVLLAIGAELYVRAQDGGLSGIGRLNFLGWRGDGSAFYAADAQSAYAFDTADLSRETLFASPGADAVVIARDQRWGAIRNGDTISLIDFNFVPRPPRDILDGETGAHALFEFSSSGRSLVYGQRAADGFMHAWRHDLTNAQTYPVMEAQADVLSVVTSISGRFMVLETGANGVVNDVAAVDQQEDRALPLRAYTRDLRFNRDDSRIFFRLANEDWPQDIFISELDGEHIIRLVHSDTAQR
jgi:hypothetical protein